MARKLHELLNEDLIFFDVEATNWQEVLKYLADNLLRKGYVNDSFYNAVVEREKKFPTGLPTGKINVAIPHTDPIHVIKDGIAVALLKQPVLFREMGKFEGEVACDIVFMLAIKNPDGQIKVLQNFMDIFMDSNLLLKIKNAKSKKEIIDIISKSN
ncbi:MULTISPECIES: PTS sugar transporter subunit IIA [Thermoanaerobacter]|jgi:PTS system galactitol-specific IIA component|uniref:PTS IIA-like nitrogen-regulatory protein PtsN n=1 Tax=Thermoanaerobacter italicus (strain DSM 9252 / Ab9) TaxID=580331 RepID=D3T770_THEIA|nr:MULTISPECIES: PTS sugar transporter subunit IIA [Thermoanaerobacter]ADD01802.1 putative PTS IIA-like nitrogen-regulatory protein PtsN [Thermoanaerobacter italicus Ab9]